MWCTGEANSDAGGLRSQMFVLLEALSQLSCSELSAVRPSGLQALTLACLMLQPVGVSIEWFMLALGTHNDCCVFDTYCGTY